MNYLPSKELLNEVLGDEYNDRLVDWLQIEDNYLRTYYDCGRYDSKGRPTGLGIEINIYELAHRCKEWALLKGYYFSIYSFNFSFNTEQEHKVRLLLGNEVVYWGNDSCEETEPEAIFKACQWIIDNRN